MCQGRCGTVGNPPAEGFKPGKGGVFDGGFREGSGVLRRQEDLLEFVGSRPPGHHGLLLQQAEVLLPPYVFRVIKKRDKRQVRLTDLQVAEIDTPCQDVFGDAARRPA